MRESGDEPGVRAAMSKVRTLLAPSGLSHITDEQERNRQAGNLVKEAMNGPVADAAALISQLSFIATVAVGLWADPWHLPRPFAFASLSDHRHWMRGK